MQRMVNTLLSVYYIIGLHLHAGHPYLIDFVLAYPRGEKMRYIKAYHGCYDPLAYPLFHPRGETGWNQFMPYNNTPIKTPLGIISISPDSNNLGGSRSIIP